MEIALNIYQTTGYYDSGKKEVTAEECKSLGHFDERDQKFIRICNTIIKYDANANNDGIIQDMSLYKFTAPGPKTRLIKIILEPRAGCRYTGYDCTQNNCLDPIFNNKCRHPVIKSLLTRLNQIKIRK